MRFGGRARRIAIVDDFNPYDRWSHGKQVRAVLEHRADQLGLKVDVTEIPIEKNDCYRIGNALDALHKRVEGGERFDAVNLSMYDNIHLNELASRTGLSLSRQNIAGQRGEVMRRVLDRADQNPFAQLSTWERESAGEIAKGIRAVDALANRHRTPVFVASGNNPDAINFFSLPPNVHTVGRRDERQADPAANNPFITHWEQETHTVPDGPHHKVIGPGPSFATPTALVQHLKG